MRTRLFGWLAVASMVMPAIAGCGGGGGGGAASTVNSAGTPVMPAEFVSGTYAGTLVDNSGTLHAVGSGDVGTLTINTATTVDPNGTLTYPDGTTYNLHVAVDTTPAAEPAGLHIDVQGSPPFQSLGQLMNTGTPGHYTASLYVNQGTKTATVDITFQHS